MPPASVGIDVHVVNVCSHVHALLALEPFVGVLLVVLLVIGLCLQRDCAQPLSYSILSDPAGAFVDNMFAHNPAYV